MSERRRCVPRFAKLRGKTPPSNSRSQYRRRSKASLTGFSRPASAKPRRNPSTPLPGLHFAAARVAGREGDKPGVIQIETGSLLRGKQGRPFSVGGKTPIFQSRSVTAAPARARMLRVMGCPAARLALSPSPTGSLGHVVRGKDKVPCVAKWRDIGGIELRQNWALDALCGRDKPALRFHRAWASCCKKTASRSVPGSDGKQSVPRVSSPGKCADSLPYSACGCNRDWRRQRGRFALVVNPGLCRRSRTAGNKIEFVIVGEKIVLIVEQRRERNEIQRAVRAENEPINPARAKQPSRAGKETGTEHAGHHFTTASRTPLAHIFLVQPHAGNRYPLPSRAATHWLGALRVRTTAP